MPGGGGLSPSKLVEKEKTQKSPKKKAKLVKKRNIKIRKFRNLNIIYILIKI